MRPAAASVALALALFPGSAPADDGPAPGTKTLARTVDPVLMEASLLDGLRGEAVERVRVYALRDGVLGFIRAQVQERTPDDVWILPEGPRSDAGEARGTLSSQDLVVFMAADAGDRLPPERWVGRDPREVMLIDPKDDARAWVYVAAFDADTDASALAPAPTAPYVRYDPERERVWSDRMDIEFLIRSDGTRTAFLKSVSVPAAAGGCERNLIDRIKARSTIRFLLSLIPFEITEDLIRSEVLAHASGPVMAVRRVEQYAPILNYKALHAVSEPRYFRDMMTVGIQIRIPTIVPIVVSDFRARVGVDFGEAALGSRIVNPHNLAGVPVDGRMGEAERNFVPDFAHWRLITGACGTLVVRTVFPGDLAQRMEVRVGVLDDRDHALPPEGVPGSIGFLFEDWNFSNLAAGTYRLDLDLYYPPHYKPGDEQAYIDYRDHPLRIAVGGREAENVVSRHEIAAPNDED